MTDYGGLQWIAKTHDIGFGLLVVRNVTPELVLARLGVPVEEQVQFTAEQAARQGDPPRIWGVRAGTVGNGWTFAVGPGGACAAEHHVRAASLDAEAVAVSYIAVKAMVWFKHMRDTHVVSSFEPGMDNALAGGPELEITDAMRAVLTSGESDRLALGLTLLRDAFGVHITEQDLDRPLLGGYIKWT